MPIRVKLTLWFLAVGLIPLFFLSTTTFKNYKNSLVASRISQLRAVTAFKAEKIETYIAGLKKDIKIAQNAYVVQKSFPVLIKLSHDPGNPKFLVAKKMINEGSVTKMVSFSGLFDIMLVDPEGRVVHCTNPEHYQKDFLNPLPDPDQKAFREGEKRTYISDVFLNQREGNRPEILITAPVFGLKGVVIGVIALEVDMAPIYKIIQDGAGLGNTGESMVGERIGNEVRYLSPLKFDSPAAQTRRIKIGAEFASLIQDAVQGKTGAGIMVDYRGREVIGAWQYIPSLNWGLVSKIDTREAFADVTKLKNLTIAILVIIFALSAIIALFLGQSFSRPIKRLAQSAGIIGAGNLDYKIETTRNDELGQLSRSFNKMTRDLKQITASRDELNKEISQRLQREKELRLSRELLLQREKLLEHAPVLVRNLNDEIILWNSGMEKIYGFPREEALGKVSHHLFQSQHPLSVSEIRAKIFQDGQWEGEIHHRRRDGSLLIVASLQMLHTDASGNPTAIIEVNTDITERKQAEKETQRLFTLVQQEKERLSALINSINDEVWFADLQKNFTLINPTGRKKFNLVSSKEVGVEKLAASLEVFRPDGSPRPAEEAPPLRALQGEVLEDLEEVIRIPATGELWYRQVNAAPVRDSAGKIIGSVCVVHDITEHRKADEALRQRTLELQQLTGTLEERIKERTAELAKLSSQLVSIQEQERKQVSYALHDHVWQNLLAIRFELGRFFSDENARDRAPLPDQAKKIMADILDAVEKIRFIQGDLWPYVLDDIGILATVEWYCREFQRTHSGIATERKDNLAENEIPQSAKIVIYRILQETLNNIAKHSQANHVTLRLIKKECRMEFIVADNGIGFNPVETIIKRTPLAGLGLLNLKARTEFSGGSFAIESAEGQGTTIRASWPL